MDIKEISAILDNLPIGRSQYEFQNFFLDAYPSSARLYAAALIEIENLYISKIEIEDQIKKKNTPAQKMKLNRQLSIINNQLKQFEKWWSSQSAETLPDNVEFEKQESMYWPNILGKQAALELLTSERTSTATMNQMVNLPEQQFVEAVRICIDSIKTIKKTTDHLEKI